ncbi:MAG: acyl-CoA dehydratase activase [Candidatus Cloacimonetes bacterium]|nr:acyl-CoA dehydratase activase [Candidatus Cloacimonadota bacterium]MCF7813311.1 acyl-CoA dehydratase activase [Candidatus Cloacimonadota bacterium]MCF7867386.1 acyl-CoA dehydratase activase [Candidatus Cloacimonadota bacterium]MCF7882820.1 acyl-CoA dehydratase activase [Candidatus Cloacimonadota bacterium]
MKKYNIGIDLGSRMAKIVVLEDQEIFYLNVADTGVNPKETAKKLLNEVLQKKNLALSDISSIYSTGYGRNIVPFSDIRISEISCHAKGVNYFFPYAKTVIDIGGQDSKIILLEKNGKVVDFAMNDKCAAGTGRFLEVTANILEITVDDLGKTADQSKEDIDINSTCVVFAESEIIGLIAAGNKPADIVNSVHRSIAKRIKNLMSQMNWQKPVVFTGGVAQNLGMRRSIAQVLNVEIESPENSLITGALGAALYAFEQNS